MDAHRQGPVVVVTGASAGIGRAIAHRFAVDGARIGLVARGEDGLAAAKREVEDLGGNALVLPGDIADPDTSERAAAAVEERFGPIDIWINNAMTSVFSPVHAMEPADYRRVTEVTYLGVVYGTLAALRRMRPRDHGTIIQIGSSLAYRGIPLQSAYCAAKHAIQGFHDSLRSELLHEDSRIHVTMVHLPATNTPQFTWVKSRLARKAQPVPPIYQPEFCADAVHHAAYHHRREHRVGAPTGAVIAGDKLVPGLGDRYLARNGYDSQQTAEYEDPERPNNLYHPLPGDHGVHGPFDGQAKTTTYAGATRRRRALAASGALALTGLIAGAVASRVVRR